MVRTILATLVLLGAVLWLPVWFQLVLFACAIVVLPYKALLVIPALVADVLYAPTSTFAFGNLRTTVLVVLAIVVWMLLSTYTRLSHVGKTQ